MRVQDGSDQRIKIDDCPFVYDEQTQITVKEEISVKSCSVSCGGDANNACHEATDSVLTSTVLSSKDGIHMDPVMDQCPAEISSVGCDTSNDVTNSSVKQEQDMIPHFIIKSERGESRNHVQPSLRTVSRSEKKPYKCDICHLSCTSPSALKRHMRVHTGEKPYSCDVCQKSFATDGHVRRHMLVHTGEKPYKCDVCQRSFAESGKLRIHMRIHTGEKPYTCKICQRSFAHSTTLKTHMRVHNREKRIGS